MKRSICLVGAGFFLTSMVLAGCVHYPVNQPIKEYRPGAGYRIAHVKPDENSDNMLFYLTFSGGGTRG
jgi:hypothetical protein